MTRPIIAVVCLLIGLVGSFAIATSWTEHRVQVQQRYTEQALELGYQWQCENGGCDGG